MKVVKIECPNCGASLEMNVNKLMVFCPYCRTELPMDFDVDKYIHETEETKRHEMELNSKAESEKQDNKFTLTALIICFGIMIGAIIYWDIFH